MIERIILPVIEALCFVTIIVCIAGFWIGTS